MISYPCGQCGHALEAPESMAGESLSCPNCGAVTRVPHSIVSGIAAPQRPYSRPAPKRGDVLGTRVLPACALIISLIALGITLWRGPGIPGKGLGAYDFSTPQNAVRSGMEIEANADLRARIELDVASAQADREKKLKSLESLQFDRTVELDGKVAVFVKYAEGGIDRYKVLWVEKKPDGRFRSTYVSTYAWTNDPGDKGHIAKMISEWEAKGKP